MTNRQPAYEPGPYTIEAEGRDPVEAYRIVGPGGLAIATVHPIEYDEEDVRDGEDVEEYERRFHANAKLLAAAPEILRLLESAAPAAGRVTLSVEEWREARAIIEGMGVRS